MLTRTRSAPSVRSTSISPQRRWARAMVSRSLSVSRLSIGVHLRPAVGAEVKEIVC